MPLPLPIPADRLEELAKQYGTPFQLYDEAGIRKACQRLKSAFEKNFPGFKEFFAVKALPNPAILKIMQQNNFDLDRSPNHYAGGKMIWRYPSVLGQKGNLRSHTSSGHRPKKEPRTVCPSEQNWH